MIFQNPRTALNPIRRVGQQIADVLVRHGGATPLRRAENLPLEMLKKVRIPDPDRRAEAYPFELSGGMCQRVMIAIALACRPALLIADEPTTGLDVTTQAVVMDLIDDLVPVIRAWRRSLSRTISRWPPNIATELSSCMPATSSNWRQARRCSPALVIPIRPNCWPRRRARRRRSPSWSRSPAICRTCVAMTCRPAATVAAANAWSAAAPPAVAARVVGERHDVACWNPL